MLAVILNQIWIVERIKKINFARYNEDKNVMSEIFSLEKRCAKQFDFFKERIGSCEILLRKQDVANSMFIEFLNKKKSNASPRKKR